MREKSRLVVLSLVSILLVIASIQSAFAATYQWKIPENIRIVQKTDTDNVRTFTSITAALGSITDASATNRYAIKVMPGSYSETVRLKPYIDLIGSGQNDTIISSSASGDVLVTDDQTAVENLTITSSNLSGSRLVYINENSTAVFRDVTLKLPANAGFENFIFLGSGGNFQLNNSQVLSEGSLSYIGFGIDASNGGSSFKMLNSNVTIATVQTNVPVAVFGENMEIINSEIKISSPSDIFAVSAYNNTKIYNSIITAESYAGGWAYAVDNEWENVEISNSKIIATAPGASSQAYGVWVTRDIVINNSTISGSTMGISKIENTTFKVGNSQITGGHNGVSGVDKVVNCIDGSFNQIPNL